MLLFYRDVQRFLKTNKEHFVFIPNTGWEYRGNGGQSIWLKPKGVVPLKYQFFIKPAGIIYDNDEKLTRIRYKIYFLAEEKIPLSEIELSNNTILFLGPGYVCKIISFAQILESPIVMDEFKEMLIYNIEIFR